tara:strand:+ start:126 stop:353 length:228 start_codon:yes stop_codon:yes gene_type:complete
MENKDQEKNSLYLKIMPYLEKYGILIATGNNDCSNALPSARRFLILEKCYQCIQANFLAIDVSIRCVYGDSYSRD